MYVFTKKSVIYKICMIHANHKSFFKLLLVYILDRSAVNLSSPASSLFLISWLTSCFLLVSMLIRD